MVTSSMPMRLIRWPCVLKDPDLGLAIFAINGASIPPTPVAHIIQPPLASPPHEDGANDPLRNPTPGPDRPPDGIDIA